MSDTMEIVVEPDERDVAVVRVTGRLDFASAGDARACFAGAVAEVAANIIQHAHPSDSHLVPFSLSLSVRPDRLVGKFTDRGIPARPPASPEMPPVTVSYTELGERGRGLALVQATTDRFEYRRTAAGENI